MVLNETLSMIILAIIQGITEWLPVSSSGHLVFAEKILGFEGGLLFDVALHFGTLMAVFVYFGGDIVDIVRDLISGKWKSDNGKLGLLILIATIPAAIIGFFFKSVFETSFSNLGIVAFGFAITGILLLIASLSKYEKKEIKSGEAIAIGIAQVFSLFPGVSRSGATISTGMLLGLKEKDALKFSFLMSIPIILGANILVIGNETFPANMIWAVLISFVVGLITLHLLYRYILTSRRNLKWFGVYALFVAFLALVFLFLG